MKTTRHLTTAVLVALTILSMGVISSAQATTINAKTMEATPPAGVLVATYGEAGKVQAPAAVAVAMSRSSAGQNSQIADGRRFATLEPGLSSKMLTAGATITNPAHPVFAMTSMAFDGDALGTFTF